MPDAATSPPVAVVGAGAVGTSLARGLAAIGYRVEAVLSRTPEAARTLADRVGASVAGAQNETLPAAVRLILICVPDDAVADVAEELAALDHPWDETIVAHTSGAKTAAVLAPVARQGAATLSFHPLQTFTEETSPEAFEDIVVGLEGEDRAVTAGETLARALGARPLRLTAAEKERYHCAAVLASNGLVALMGVVEEVFGTVHAREPPDSVLDLMAPLVEQTWTNLKRETPEGVLTGPVARGDTETVQAHLDALASETPHLVPLYAALSTEMVRLAVRAGDLTEAQAEALLAALREAADTVGEEGESRSR